MSSLSDAVARACSEWKANARLRIGALVVVSIVLLSFLQWLDGWREERMQAAAVAMQEASDLKLVASQGEWVGRAESAANAYALLQKRLWLVASDGAAQAAVRDLLQAEARAVGLKIQRVTVRSLPSEGKQPFTAVRVEVEGEYKPLAWQQFVSAIEAHEPTVIIESDRIDRSNSPIERYRLNATAWYRLEAPGKK